MPKARVREEEDEWKTGAYRMALPVGYFAWHVDQEF
jgi:hypothetical protein